ncbi:MAG: serine/threonine protein phosphatase [Thermodesulfovibrionia bacterium]|nr:serine/threonine protein phosphatase [Thermodesulfovibrionia bacterium]
MRNSVFTSSIKNVYVAGDLHGHYESFKGVLRRYEDSARDSLLLFLGDYADRGLNGVEIITELNRLLESRDDIVALKGNHEQYRDGNPTFSPCDLISEAQEKYNSWEKFYHDIMVDFLAKLHIAAIMNNVLFVHAGISSRIKTVKDLAKHENETYVLWSDPSPLSGEHPSMRGAGITFGEDITTKVLSALGLKMIVRSHEPSKAAYGPYSEHGGKIITTNACASYGEPWKPFMLKIDTKSLKHKPIFL